MWHQLHGNPGQRWPDDEYFGHHGLEGQPLSLYSTTGDRAIQVAYRRAANTLAANLLIEIQHRRVARSDVLYARLPVSTAGQTLADGLDREYKARKAHQGQLQMFVATKVFPPGLDPRGAQRMLYEHEEWIWKFEHIDRGPAAPQRIWLRTSLKG